MQRRSAFLLLTLALMGTGMSCSQRPETVPSIPQASSALSASGGDSAVPAEKYQVRLETTKGDVVIEVYPEWAPLGAARFRELVSIGFYNDCAFFRVLPGFMAQFGMNGNPEIHNRWAENRIKDDPVKQSNQRGYVTFAKTGMPDSRSTQLFINFEHNKFLDVDGFAPIGKVIEGLEVIESLYSGYGESASQQQPTIAARGNEFLREQFPKLDYIKLATLVDSAAPPAQTTEASE